MDVWYMYATRADERASGRAGGRAGARTGGVSKRADGRILLLVVHVISLETNLIARDSESNFPPGACALLSLV